MIDKIETKATILPIPQPIGRPETPAQPFPRTTEAGSRGEDGVAGRPMAAWLCDELYEGRNYSRQPVVDSARD